MAEALVVVRDVLAKRKRRAGMLLLGLTALGGAGVILAGGAHLAATFAAGGAGTLAALGQIFGGARERANRRLLHDLEHKGQRITAIHIAPITFLVNSAASGRAIAARLDSIIDFTIEGEHVRIRVTRPELDALIVSLADLAPAATITMTTQYDGTHDLTASRTLPLETDVPAARVVARTET